MALHDGQPWDEKERDSLNPSSHAAQEVFSVVGMAIEVLERSEHTVSPRNVQAVSATLLHIINSAQTTLLAEGKVDLQSFSHARLREALAVVLGEPSMPRPPFWTSEAEFSEWVGRVIKRLNSIATTAIWLWSDGPGNEPWRMLFDESHNPHAAKAKGPGSDFD